MYYNSNKSSNDYYNAYKKELAQLEAYRKEENRHKIIKIVLFFLLITLLIVTAFYLYKYFNPRVDLKNSSIQGNTLLTKSEVIPTIRIREEELPQSIQLREATIKMAKNIHENATDTTKVVNTDNTPMDKSKNLVANMNEEDIALIVQTIMVNMHKKVEKPLEKQLQEVDTKVYASKSLEKINHYNKIILTKNEVADVKNASLMELRDNIDNIINEKDDTSSTYRESIKKEVHFRENEMRVIIVQRGDTLSRIAKKAYGNYDDYPKIFAANPEIIKNPNQIFVGQRLRIPA